jgi:hypothetical protein
MEERQARLRQRINEKKTMAPRLRRPSTSRQSRHLSESHEPIAQPSFSQSVFDVWETLSKVCLCSLLAIGLVAFCVNQFVEFFEQTKSSHHNH